MTGEITFEEFSLKLLGALNNCRIDYIVVGGVAVWYPALCSSR